MRQAIVLLVMAGFVVVVIVGCGGSSQQPVQVIGSITPGQQPVNDIELLIYPQGKANAGGNPIIQQHVTDLLPAGESVQFDVSVPSEGTYDIVVQGLYAVITNGDVPDIEQLEIIWLNVSLSAPSTDIGVLNLNLPVP